MKTIQTVIDSQRRSVLAGVLLILAAGSLLFGGPAIAAENTKMPGSYTIVGTGPGDADLLTLRGAAAIEKADIVFCGEKTVEKYAGRVDFTGKQVLSGYSVLFRYYGKACPEKADKDTSRRGRSCEQYHQKQAEFATLVREAVSKGRHVVLLSSGDPTIYGPDIWSLQELKDLDPKLIPGLSAFNAASAALKVSLNEVILTAPFTGGNRKDTLEDLSVHKGATVVIFMPRDMKALFARLSKAYAADTPVAIVSSAGVVKSQAVIMGTVGEYAQTLPDVQSGRSIVYVGTDLANARCQVASTAAGDKKGKYYLVGVGPGDADLATLRAIDVMKKADLVFARENMARKFKPYLEGKEVLSGYHRLFPFYKQKCENKKSTGDASGRRQPMSCETYHQKQEEFAALVRKAVAEGKTVAMLDGGDPLVYGPCAWSLTELSDIETEVVPGLSCFNAANAALRAGVTEGKSSHSVILASGWSVEKMAASRSTMVLFTMRTKFQKFVDGLSKHYSADTPVAIVFSAGYAEKEKVMHGTLGSILDQVGSDRLPFEYLLYVGDFLKESVDLLK